MTRTALYVLSHCMSPLITCPDCSAQVSDTAPHCPRCGRPAHAQPVTGFVGTNPADTDMEAAVKRGQQRAKGRYESGKALGCVGAIAGLAFGALVGSIELALVLALLAIIGGVIYRYS